MRHSPQACFNAAQNDRCILIFSSDQVAINGNRMIRSFKRLSSRCIGIRRTMLFGYKIVIDHGVHVSGADEKGKARLSEHVNAFLILPVRLGNDPDLVAVCFQKPCNDRMPKGRVIHIGISRDIDKINLRPASVLHLFSCNR